MCQIVNYGRMISALVLVYIVKEFIMVDVWKSRKHVENVLAPSLNP